MGKSKYIKYIPNIFTLANMSSGLASILFLLQAEHQHKALVVPAFILIGGIADFFDGYFARKLNAITDMGKQLDSFADIITFGIAPIALLNYLSASEHSIPIIVSSLIFVLAGAYRLARYNLNDFKKHFIGLPITAAGVILAIYCVAYSYWIVNISTGVSITITVLVTVVLSILMVSKKKINRPLF
jgi:CDP-diacylglycerol--serine O-phosphatidyltransferase